jgi:hypothetical protein
MFNNGSIIYLCNYIKNIDLNGGDTTEDEWSALITANSQKLFGRLLGVPDLYQVDAARERRGAELSRSIQQMLRPFLVVETIAAGTIDLSSKDLAYFLAMEPTSISGRGFDELDPSEVAARIGDSVVAPTEDDPAFEWYDGNTIITYPSTILQVVLKYYKYPTDADVVFTQNPETLRKTYDATASTETGWGKKELIEIAYMCLRDSGMNLTRTELTQYANQIVENE